MPTRIAEISIQVLCGSNAAVCRKAALAFATAPFLLAAAGKPPDVDAMLARYHQVTTAGDPACARDAEDDRGAIIVCGRGNSRYRAPLPAELGPPDGPRRRTGDLPRGIDALGATSAPPRCCGGDPPKSGETLYRIFSWLKGEDPD